MATKPVLTPRPEHMTKYQPDKVSRLGIALCEVIFGDCPCKKVGWPDEHYANIEGTQCNESICTAIAIDQATRFEIKHLLGHPDWISERISNCPALSAR